MAVSSDNPPAPAAAVAAPAPAVAAVAGVGPAPAPDAPPRLPRVNWMFGLQLRNVHSIWNLWDRKYEKLARNDTETKAHNALHPDNSRRSYLEILHEKTGYKKGRALSCEMTGYFMFILPIMYMSMSVFRNISDDLDYRTGDTSTRDHWTKFKDFRRRMQVRVVPST